MTRAVITEILIFLVPFALFAAFLLARKRNPFLRAAWSGQVSWLALAGLALAIAGLVYMGATSERRQGPFVPTHLENGRVVPGEFQ
jgi:hypothetical protein